MPNVNFKNGTIIEMLFLNVSMTVESLFLLYLQEKFGAFFSYNLHLAIRVPHMRIHTCDVKSRD